MVKLIDRRQARCKAITNTLKMIAQDIQISSSAGHIYVEKVIPRGLKDNIMQHLTRKGYTIETTHKPMGFVELKIMW